MSEEQSDLERSFARLEKATLGMVEELRFRVRSESKKDERIAKLEAALKDFDAKHQYENLRSIAARCEKGGDPRDLLHDLWKVMSEVNDLARLKGTHT